MIIIPKFAVVAVNAQNGVPGLMGYAETSEEAVDIQESALRAGGQLVTICDSPAQLHDFGRVEKLIPPQK